MIRIDCDPLLDWLREVRQDPLLLFDHTFVVGVFIQPLVVAVVVADPLGNEVVHLVRGMSFLRQDPLRDVDVLDAGLDDRCA